jgi:hypothetical protein
MSKFTKLQRNQLKSLVTNAMIRRLTSTETQKYIEENLHMTVTPKYIYNITAQIKRDCSKELNLLQKDREYYLKHAFFDRIAELEEQQKVLWDIVNKNKEDKPDSASRAIHELHGISLSLKRFYDNLPVIAGLPTPVNYTTLSPHYQWGRNELGQGSTGTCPIDPACSGCPMCSDNYKQDGVDENGNPIL